MIKTIMINKINKIRIDKKGFTMIEMLLYLGLITMILVAVSAFFSVLMEARIKNQTIVEVDSQGVQIMQAITQAARNSNEINSPARGSAATALSLASEDSSKNSTIIGLNGQNVYIQEGSQGQVLLNNSQVKISNFSFANFSRANTNGIVSVSFTVTYNNSTGKNEYDFSKTFYGSAALRY